MDQKNGLKVSVVVPAYNAASTLEDAISSLRAQTYLAWEAIIVDDGSTDDTAAVAARLADEEPRIRLLSQQHSGVSVARNAGIRAASYDWLLFLDADDWIAPNHLQKLTGLLAEDPGLDAVHCGWAWIAPSGETFRVGFGPPCADLFPVLARRPAFVIHACVVRRALVEAVGAFEVDLSTSEDWDLWQRVARRGARFGAAHEVLAFYRMRFGSASNDITQCLVDGFRVIRRGHSRDPRVAMASSKYVGGAPDEGLYAALFCFLAHYAGVVMSRAGDARPLLQHIPADGELAGASRCIAGLQLNPQDIADTLFDAIPLGANRSVHSWRELWPEIQFRLGVFLDHLEKASGVPQLADRVQRQVERLILREADLQQPVTIGRSHGVRIDATRPIPDIPVPMGVDRLHCVVYFENEFFKRCELPALGRVSADTIIDAMAPDSAHLARLTGYVLRSHTRAVARNARFWQALAAFSVSKRNLRAALNLVRGKNAGRRASFVQWRREAVAFLADRRAVIGAARRGRQARSPAAELAAIVRAEQAQVSAAATSSFSTGGEGCQLGSRFAPDCFHADERVAGWEEVFSRPNPWGYKSDYEQVKYEQTLAMLPSARPKHVLELACAEGHFTAQLASRVECLTAADLSPTALRRAVERCRDLVNIRFVQLDLLRDPLPGRFDLIVCSEVLYYVPDRATLAAVANRLAEHLEPDGHLLMAHANLVVDEPEETGFGWQQPFGAKVIGEIVAESASLRLVREFRTPLYRIQLFRRTPNKSAALTPPEIIESTVIGDMTPEAVSQVRWRGPMGPAPMSSIADTLPILMYHRVASEG